jgi:ribosomal protein L7/L12
MEQGAIWIAGGVLAAVLLLALAIRSGSRRPREIGGSPAIDPTSGASVVGGPNKFAASVDAAGQSAENALAEGEREVRILAAAGEKIQAIKRVRELTGLGLKEAKDYVELLPNAPALAGLTQLDIALDGELEQTVRALLRDGRKLEAIALCREETGLDLAQAKAAVERLG